MAKKIYKKDHSLLLKVEGSKKANIYLYLMFSLFALIIKDYRNITYTKYLTFVILTVLFIASIIFSIVKRVIDGYKISFEFDKCFFFKPEFFLLLHILFCVISSLFSPYKGSENLNGQSQFWHGSGRYDGFLVLLLYVTIFFILSYFGELKCNHIIVIAVTTLLMSLITFIQFCGINFWNFYPAFYGVITKFVSTIGNLGMFSGLLSMFISIIMMAYIFLQNSRNVKILFCITLLISLYVFYTSGVNSGRVALFVVMIVLFPFALEKMDSILNLLDINIIFASSILLMKIIAFKYIRKQELTEVYFVFDKNIIVLALIILVLAITRMLFNKMDEDKKQKIFSKRSFMIVGILFIIALVVVLNIIILNGRTAFEKGTDMKEEIINLSQGNLTAESGNYRIAIWGNALSMGKENLFFGTGIGTFYDSFREFMAGTPIFKTAKKVDTAHNEYIHLFCTVGIFGLLTYLGFLISLAIKGFKNIYKNPYVIILGSAVLGYAVYAFFSFNIVIVTPVFWIFLGLLYSKIKQDN